MPRGYRNRDGQIVGTAARAKATGKPDPLPVPGPGRNGYPVEVRDAILDRMMCGETMSSVCRDENMPSLPTVYRWLHEDAGFQERMALARRAQARTWFDEGVDAARAAHDRDSAIVGRVKGDVLTKAAGILNPEEFAPRQQGGGAIQVIINTSLDLPAQANLDGGYVVEVPADGAAGEKAKLSNGKSRNTK